MIGLISALLLQGVPAPSDVPVIPAFVDHALAAETATAVRARCLDGRRIEVTVASGVKRTTQVELFSEDGVEMSADQRRLWSDALANVRSVIGVEITCAGPSDLVTVEGWPFDKPDRPHRLKVHAFIVDGRVTTIDEVRVN